ncbi:MAG: hypothetical protein K2K97_03570 [Muribaculaceae bacterium]|nr:hypothetical protein [Muribaculaceae bacterium]
MNLDELKKSMSTLDDVLAQKCNEPINFNIETSTSAQTRIIKQYHKSILNCGILAIVFIILWISGTDESAFPVAMKGFLGVFMAIAAIVYLLLYRSVKKIKLASSAPMQIMKQVASLRLYTLVAEIFFAVVLAVFFTIFLSNLWTLGTWTFWLVSGALLVSIIIALIMLPKKIRDFRELTAVD